jgi:uncharacterized protein YabE (DUF348 family)/3D (Asp-Asp-Asp) domain-containing protein
MRESKRTDTERKPLIIRAATLATLAACVLLLLAQTAFAQNTYVITDGGRVLVHTTPATDPEKVLGEAGLALSEDDTYTTQAGIGVSEITVQRNHTVTIDNCGNVLTVRSYGETVKELLERLHISLNGDAAVSVPLDTVVSNGMVITLIRNAQYEEVYTTVLAYETVYCKDASLPAGKQVVLVQGQDGEAVCTANVTYVNGQETGRTLLQQTVTKRPVDEVIAVGTGAPVEEEQEQEQDSYDLPYIGDGFIITASGEVLTYTDCIQMEATAYTHTDAGCNMITATGTTVRVGTVAVDPRVIPYGTRMFIISNDGYYIYGIATAEDCGGAINNMRIDLYFETTYECFQFGRRNCQVYILG